MELIKREKYLEKIRPYYGKDLIKVLTGQRRVGKSYLLQLIRLELEAINPTANIIFIDLERFEFDKIRTYEDLYLYIKTAQKPGDNYLFIDEIQNIEGFERAIRSLLSEGNCDIYITGSNSAVFSGEIATFLSGRQVVINIHSLSFTEYLLFNELDASEQALMRYLKHGGLPYLRHIENDDDLVTDYLRNIYNTILYRDVVSRNQIRDIPFLENLTRFLADNTGSLTSATRIADYLKSQRNSKSVSVIINYLNYLEQAYFINSVRRRNVQGKRIFDSGEKFYFQDLGLRNLLTGYKPAEIAKIIENAVYNHLIYLGNKVYVGKMDDKEIDFIAEQNGEFAYYQVAYLLNDTKVIEREFGNLLKIADHYPKYVISMDNFPITSSTEGIKHIHLMSFLLEE